MANVSRTVSRTPSVVINEISNNCYENESFPKRCVHESEIGGNAGGDRPKFEIEVEERLNVLLSKLQAEYEHAKDAVHYQSNEAFRCAQFTIESRRNQSLNRLELQYEHQKQDLERRAREHMWLLECKSRKAANDSHAIREAQKPLLKQIVTCLPNPADMRESSFQWSASLPTAMRPTSPSLRVQYYQPVFNGNVEFPLIYTKPYSIDPLNPEQVFEDHRSHLNHLENAPP